MGALLSIGNTLVSSDELEEKEALGTLETFRREVKRDPGASLSFRTGTARASALRDESETTPFTPIGLGKPLSLEIMTVYTGDAPGRSWVDRLVGRSKPDLLVTSGVKSLQTHGAASRAVNQIVRDIDDNATYRPGALREGSPVLYYSPAVVNGTTLVTVELVADSFSGDVFTQLSSLFTTAAGLPVFAPAAAYLLAGATITRIAEKLGHALLETGPFLTGDLDIRFNTAGRGAAMARFVVFVNDRDTSEFSGYRTQVVEEGGQDRVLLVDERTETEYRGARPYVIASLDGAERGELAEFTPQHASAALLEQFYGTQRLGGVAEVLQDSLRLYNDFTFRQKAERLKKELGALPADAPQRAEAEKLLQAYMKNIGNDVFRQGI